MKVVIAGGTGWLGQRLADNFHTRGDDVVILTRRRRNEIRHRQVEWDGRTVGQWSAELAGAIVVNLAGELVDRPPSPKNVELLRQSRVEPTRALVQAAARLHHQPVLWLQMSTLAIYGDAGQRIVDEQSPVADGPPQMPGVARPWEAAVEGAATDRLVILRTGIVLDHGTPAFERLVRITKLGLGGRIGDGEQWISWVHADDFVEAVLFLRERELDGVVHVTAPNPIQNRDMMGALRGALRRRWSPPTPKPLVQLGAMLMRTDPALALTGRRCVPQRLLEAGFSFQHPMFAAALDDILESRPVEISPGAAS
ncbi:MAG TPA: TIGR01777 family oxidoreductase [Acidimicrobiales bacterium]|nr:TIGR01777 family oxidoreductase [Acidimicrobiales bacterium]